MKKLTITHKSGQLKAFLALTKASIINSLRNPTSLFFNFFFPFIFISIFGLLSPSNVTFDVAVTQNSLKSGVLYETLSKIEVLHLITDKTDDQIQDDLKKGKIPMAITIQENGFLSINSTTKVPKYSIELSTSAADPSGASTTSSIVNSVIASMNLSGTTSKNLLVSKSEKVIEGRKYSQIDFILPGQLAFALLTNALFGIAFTFISYRKELILKRYFASPVKKITILGSEMLSKACIAILQALIILAVGHYLFHFTLANGFWTVLGMLALSVIGIFTFLSFGLLIPSIAKTEDGISPIANLIMMPQLFLSGAFFPIDAFPAFLQPIARIMPMTFLNEAFKKVAFEGADLTAVLPNIGALLLWGIVIYTIDVFLFKWE